MSKSTFSQKRNNPKYGITSDCRMVAKNTAYINQEQSQYDEALAAIVNNMGQMTALQNTLTELWIEQEERIKSLENNFKAMAKALNGIGKIWD